LLGYLDPPLGKVRLHIVRLVSESIPQKMNSFFNAIKDTNLIETIISLFFVSIQLFLFDNFENKKNDFGNNFRGDIFIHQNICIFTPNNFFTPICLHQYFFLFLHQKFVANLDQNCCFFTPFFYIKMFAFYTNIFLSFRPFFYSKIFVFLRQFFYT